MSNRGWAWGYWVLLVVLAADSVSNTLAGNRWIALLQAFLSGGAAMRLLWNKPISEWKARP